MALKNALTLVLLLVSHVAGAMVMEPVSLIAYESPPLVIDEHDKPVGLSVDLLEELFQRAGIRYQLFIQPTKRALKSTQQGQHTCTFPVTRTQEREAHFSWTGPIAISRLGLYSHPDKRIALSTLHEAKPQHITARLGSSIDDYLRSRDFVLFTSVTPEQGFHMLMKKRVDLWAVDVRSAEAISKRLRINLGEPELEFYTSIYYLACNTAFPTAMQKKLDTTLEELYLSGWVEKALNLKL